MAAGRAGAAGDTGRGTAYGDQPAGLGNARAPHVEPEPANGNGENGVHAPPLERIATLLEEIDERRESEARRPR